MEGDGEGGDEEGEGEGLAGAMGMDGVGDAELHGALEEHGDGIAIDVVADVCMSSFVFSISHLSCLKSSLLFLGYLITCLPFDDIVIKKFIDQNNNSDPSLTCYIVFIIILI